MSKLIFLVIIAVAIWAYFTHFDFSKINVNDLQKNATQIENNAEKNISNGVKGEKTIFKVNEMRNEQNKQAQDAINN